MGGGSSEVSTVNVQDTVALFPAWSQTSRYMVCTPSDNPLMGWNSIPFPVTVDKAVTSAPSTMSTILAVSMPERSS